MKIDKFEPLFFQIDGCPFCLEARKEAVAMAAVVG